MLETSDTTVTVHPWILLINQDNDILTDLFFVNGDSTHSCRIK